MRSILILFIFLINFFLCYGQSANDSAVQFGKNYITLKEVVVDTKLNVPAFIQKVKTDTSFYKAFKNLRILGYSAINDIRMLNKSGGLSASLHSKTKQETSNGCRSMKVLEEQTSGDMYDKNLNFNYYTAQLYASLFFTKGNVCGETNIVGINEFSLSDKSGIEKHKEQLKMLFFNPGKRIAGLPFMSNKTALFDDDVAENYDMEIDMDVFNGNSCYVFRQKVKQGREDNVIVDEMTTWFNDSAFDVVARNYSLAYNAGVYDFKVNMEVQMTKYNGFTVPNLIRYNGDWKLLFKKRERGVFTATLSNFE